MEHRHIIEQLDRRRGDRTWAMLAAEIGISESVLSRVRSGVAAPGPKMLAYLGLRQKTVYVKVEQWQ
jgi:hypothetical protein